MPALQRVVRTVTVVAILAVGCVALPVAGLTIPLHSNPSPQVGRVLPITDPTQLPRLTFDDLQYAGAFRLPAGEANGDSFASGGGLMAFNPDGNSLFVGARSGRVAEVSVPAPVTTTDISALPFAEYLQPFADPAEGRISEIAAEGATLSGLLIYQQRTTALGSSTMTPTIPRRCRTFPGR